MAGWMIGVAFLSIVVVFLAWKMQRQRKEIEAFSGQLEKWLDEMVSGREIIAGKDTEDSLYGRVGEKISRVNHIWKRKEEEGQKEKEALKELISDISHQIKTPLANIKIYLELLEGEKLLGQANEFVCSIARQTEKLDFLLQGMVKMSRLETGVIHIRKSPALLIETLGRAVQSVVPRAEEKGLSLSAECDEKLMVSHDIKWTEEAVFNILDNAVKYTPYGGVIQLTVIVQEIYVKISIKDSGKGIRAERLAEIFTRFYREPEVHGQDGIGIGLYLARKIIELQNGYIEVYSEVGKGSEFQVYLERI
ncbi:MAG: HAMP domain-containing histidine kinase [Lachnospiraceae bacterium]|nr:HAMP domain-containing histidine kinase [Lachnospiraceae bacterium]